MQHKLTMAGALLGLGLLTTTALAQSGDKVRVGLIFTLSGPAATLGQQGRDGFNLAVREMGGNSAARRPRSWSRTTSSSPMSPSPRSKA